MDNSQKYIDMRQEEILKLAKKVESELTDKIIAYINERLGVDGKTGKISRTISNRKAAANITKLIAAIEKKYGKEIAKNLADAIVEITKLTSGNYTANATAPRLAEITTSVQEKLKKTLGIGERGAVIKGGYIDTIINNPVVASDIRKILYNEVVLGKSTIKDVQNLVHAKINGAQSQEGIMTRYVNALVFDTFTQTDRTANVEFAKKLDLKYFVYAGGLIEASRDFCIKRNNKVFTTDEAEDWFKDPTLPRTKAEKESGVVSGYSPLIDMGRWNCRHSVRFISKQLAFNLEPRLKDLEKK